jgi:hypothetical protein
MNNPTFLVAHHRPDIVSGAEIAIADMVKACDPGWHFIMLVPGQSTGGVLPWLEYSCVGAVRFFTATVIPGLHQIESLFFADSYKRHIFRGCCQYIPGCQPRHQCLRNSENSLRNLCPRVYASACALPKIVHRAARILAVSQALKTMYGQWVFLPKLMWLMT